MVPCPFSNHSRVGGSRLSVPGQRVWVAQGGQWGRAGCQPHTEPSLPGKAEGEGGMWEVLGTTERYQSLPRKHMLQSLLCPIRLGSGHSQQQCHHSADGTQELPVLSSLE